MDPNKDTITADSPEPVIDSTLPPAAQIVLTGTVEDIVTPPVETPPVTVAEAVTPEEVVKLDKLKAELPQPEYTPPQATAMDNRPASTPWTFFHETCNA